MRESVKLLFKQFKLAPDHTLSKQDVAEDVLFDPEATNGAIRTFIYDARKLIKPYEKWKIVTIYAKGYKLIKIKTLREKPSS